LSGTASGLGGDDVFTLNDGGSAGTVDGGTGSDTATYANRGAAVTVAVDTFTSIENLVGSGFDDTLQGTAGADTFTVTAADAGNSGSVTFSSFENLAGLAGDDTFNLNAGVSGTVDGGVDNDTIVGIAAANTFVVAGAANGGTANGTTFANVENLTGGAAADTFTFDEALSGTASGLGGDDVFTLNDGGSAGTVDGGTGTDSLSYAARTSGVSVDLADIDGVENFTGSGFDDAFILDGDEDDDINIDGGAGSDDFSVVSTSQISGDLSVSNVEDALIDANVTADNITLSVNGTIVQSSGVLSAQSLTTTSVGGQSLAGAVSTFDASNSGGGDVDLVNSGDLTVTSISQVGGGIVSVGAASNLIQSGNITSDGGSISMSAANGSLTMAETAATESNGGDINYETTGAGGDVTLGLLRACADCELAGSTGAVTVTAVGSILGQPRQGDGAHITAVSALLVSGGGIGADPDQGGTQIVFKDMSLEGDAKEGAPIHLEAPGIAYIDSGQREFTSSGRVFDQSAGSRETAASAQAAALEEEEEVDWAAYSEDITVYEINNEGVQLPEVEEEDEFVKVEDEGVNVPIASNN